MPKQTQTVAMEESFKGKSVLKIITIDEKGNCVDRFGPLLSVGLKKAEAILKHHSDIVAYVKKYKEQDKSDANEPHSEKVDD